MAIKHVIRKNGNGQTKEVNLTPLTAISVYSTESG